MPQFPKKRAPQQLSEKQYFSRWRVEFSYLMRILLIAVVVVGSVFLLFHFWLQKRQFAKEFTIHIFPRTEEDAEKICSMQLVSKKPKVGEHIEVEGSTKNVLQLKRSGIVTSVVAKTERHNSNSAAYPSLSAIYTYLDSMTVAHSDVAKLDTIGYSGFYRYPILAMKISDHPQRVEDEPAILFLAAQHAREPIGPRICLALIEHLLHNRQTDIKVQDWLQKLEIWLVPVVNPDGYEYVLSQKLKSPWWRKNFQDNDGDGRFNPLMDGVDVNRNWDFNWNTGDDSVSSSWYYRGKAPFSASELVALRNLIEKRRFVIAIDYHSFGESVLYPWVMEIKPPEWELIRSLAQELAGQIHRLSGKGGYGTCPLNGKVGQSANWLYATQRCLAFIVEAGNEYFPPSIEADRIVQANLQGIFFLFDRIFRASITGVVRAADSGQPLVAIVQMEKDFSPVVAPYRTNAIFGRFWRLTSPGLHSLIITKAGFLPYEVNQIQITAAEQQHLEVHLQRDVGYGY